ncbi:MAG: ABC transporter permease [candidate division KSB1 bacterium]|nr:ABC transporter permease [candidate division KSB1 bacterium]MDZ7274210.1 ABC transporter permease [candidate division KSB1 bacterium]MDZ7287268.1 ABC transporter permease [candidate division KSB1 bacterium]MDZ7296808.1 ABC transporter permease [candidate division KSB1 bacterium]MDZ7308439.1 ABC transporter permease [candidate division KSB1 bacterium]
MEWKIILEIATQELTINIRNRWTLIFAVVFGALVLSISYFGMRAEGFSGMQNFTRTSASILNLVLYLVPLVALIMGTLSFTGDKGATELLYSQPVLRSEVQLGKLLGVFGSMALSTLIGFTLAGALVVAANGMGGLLRYSLFVALALLLALVFLCLAALVATANQRKTRAFGVALFLWFFFVFFYDLLAIGVTVWLRGGSANTFLFVSLFGNPVDMVRVAALIILDGVTIFGAAGAALLRFLGGKTASVALLLLGLAVWICFPLWVSQRLLRHQDI